jgi:hypothetical protein
MGMLISPAEFSFCYLIQSCKQEVGESGLHQRLDICRNDDRCRVRKDNSLLVLGMMLRLRNSLYMHGASTSDAQTKSPRSISNPLCPKTITVLHSAWPV